MKKIIVGIISEDKELAKTFVCHALKHGFRCFSINDKVLEISKYLMPLKNCENQNDIEHLRERGYNVHRLYWANMLLSSIPEKCNRILIPDMWEEDCVKDVMKIYRLNDKTVQDALNDFSNDIA